MEVVHAQNILNVLNLGRDQPLLLYYHKVFWSKMTDKNTRDNNNNEPPPPEYTSMAKINGGKDRVDIGGIGISFRR